MKKNPKRQPDRIGQMIEVPLVLSMPLLGIAMVIWEFLR